MGTQNLWLTLTDLGRRFGISAVACGKLLSDAGMRDENGLPNDVAIDEGYAYCRPDQNANRSTLWHLERCTELLQGLGLHAIDDQQLVVQWADLLAALEEGSPSIKGWAEYRRRRGRPPSRDGRNIVGEGVPLHQGMCGILSAAAS